jgi:gliding motility-associated-like protein
MKNKLHILYLAFVILFVSVIIQPSETKAQCVNADFELGNFTGWTGTFCINGDGCSSSSGSFLSSFLGGLITGGFPNPFKCIGIDPGTINQAANKTPEKNHFIMTSGFDPIIGVAGIPVLFPKGGKSSARLGNAQAKGGGESMMYKYIVSSMSTSFTYNYAVVLNDGGHQVGQQPYFRIRMWVYNSPTDSVLVNCATYDIDATLAKNAASGFSKLGSDIYWKSWTAVTIPLQDYVGKTVGIRFTTRDCCPNCDAQEKGTGGGDHYAYAYIDASCTSSEIIPSAPSVCSGQNVTLTAPEGAATYAWTGPTAASIVSGGNTNVATVNQPGTYTVTMTTFGATPCTYSLTAFMPVNLLGSGVTVNSTTICAGGSAILTASGGFPYLWSPGGAMTNSITVSPGSTTSYSVTGGTCPSSATGVVTVTPLPTSTFTVTPACAGQGSTITYTGNAPATANYNWNWGGGTVISGSGQGPYSISWASSGSPNVSLMVTNGACISPLTTNAVTVNPAPIVTINPSTVCAGTAGTLTAAGASTYLWSDGTIGATLNATVNAATNYTVTGTAGSCSSTKVGTIAIFPPKDASFSYTPATICKTGGSNPTPVIAGTTGGTYASTINDANLNINASTGIVDLATTPVGTYTISYTTPSPCPVSSNYVINIVKIPVADFTFGTYCKSAANPSPTFINGGSAGTFSSSVGLVFESTSTGIIDLAASTAGNYNITNTIAAAGGCPDAVSSNTITINPSPVTTVNSQTICNGSSTTLTANGATTYSWSDGSAVSTLTAAPSSNTSYTVTGTTTGCSSTAVGTITVNPKPFVTVNNPTVCAGVTTTLMASGAASYLWSDNSTGSALTPSVVANSTSYTVTGTSLGCSTSAIANITVNQIPNITVNSPFICKGNNAILTAVGANSYLWSTGSNANSITVIPATTTSYTVTGTSAGCSASAVSTVTITKLPVLTVNSPAICIGQSATLNAAGGASYTWFPGGTTGNSLTVSPLTNTTYTVSDTTPGCLGSAISNITVNSLPIVTVNAQTICFGQSATLTASGAATYEWADGSIANPYIISPINTSSYTVTGASVAGCVNTVNTTVTVNPLPIVSASSASVCKGISASLTATGALTYVWSNGATTNPLKVSPNVTTPYTVTGTDANGCSAKAVGTVVIYKKPNAQFSLESSTTSVFDPVVRFNNMSSLDVNYWFWDFGDGDTLADGSLNPTHTFPGDTGSYNATLIVHNAGFCYDTINNIVLIGPEYSFYIPSAFTPDGDATNDLFFGKGVGIVEYELMIFDRWGNQIFTADDINKGWDGKVKGGAEAAQQDVYVWKVHLKDIFHKTHNYTGTVTILRGR